MPGIVNGRAWLSERRRFLQEELAKDPPEEQRAAIEAELAAVDQQIGQSGGHWWRWLFGARPSM
ncbi:MAG: hypothetical protein ACRDZ8_17375 [Acidimicrobiales bacterium]